MRIAVGSLNPAKVSAVREIVADYDALLGADVDGVDAPSGVADQPKSLEETIRGAMNRARAAFRDCAYSVGIESGIVEVPYTKTGWMDVCACAVHDGAEFHLGLSSLFECPKDVVDMMLRDGCDMAQAFNRCGYTDDPKLGASQGAIGLLTRGRVDRKAYTIQALRAALIHVENALAREAA
jgi:inosine/xanthosine triphosphatase